MFQKDSNRTGRPTGRDHRSLIAISLCVAAGLCVTLAGTQTTWGYPEPALVSKDWSLDFNCDAPQTIMVRDEEGRPRWYWYLTYRVENNSGQDPMFIPEVTIATDSGTIISANKDVPSSVFDAIKKSQRNPLLERSTQIIGKILQGIDHGKDGVVIWEVPEEDTDEYTLFFSGLSGENKTIPHPISGESVLVRKTLMIHYATPGTPQTPQNPTVIEKDRRWVMR